MDNSFSNDKILHETNHPRKKLDAPKKEKPKWFKVLFSILMVGILLGLYGLFFSGEMVNSVQEQLSKLRENRITQAYYEYTTKAFQENTSLENFRDFISLYKVLSDNKSFIVEDQSRSNGTGKVTGVLISNDLNEMNIEYQLVKEEKQWKIQSIRLKELKNGKENDSVTQELVNKVHDQLKALQNDEIMDAYYAYFTKDFQNETPFQVFQEYVVSHPILTSYKNIEFKNRRIEDSTGHVDLVLGSDTGNYILEYVLKRENGDWKIWNLKLVLPPEEAAKKVQTNPDSLVIPVRELLDDLLLDKIETAYQNTAREFQEATSLSAFENFVHTHPVLSQRDLTDIRSGKIENGVGKLRVNLHDDEGLTVIEFKLGYDEGAWKIWGVQVLENPERKDSESYSQEGDKLNQQSLAELLIEVIKDQLRTLKHQDFVTAYYHLHSEEFQEGQTLPDFENFLEENPLFTQGRVVQFDRMMQNGKKITLKGILGTFDYKNHPVSYELIKEDDEWKINKFEAFDELEPIAENEDIKIFESEDKDVEFTDIKKITIGDEVDLNGMIKIPRVVLDQGVNLLFFNIEIEDGKEDSLVTLFLNHVDSSTTAPPLSTKLKKDGSTIISFSYAAPSGGWPEGNYLVKVTTNTGDEHIQGFQLRKGEKKFYE